MSNHALDPDPDIGYWIAVILIVVSFFLLGVLYGRDILPCK
jgi:hypothetical protein